MRQWTPLVGITRAPRFFAGSISAAVLLCAVAVYGCHRGNILDGGPAGLAVTVSYGTTVAAGTLVINADCRPCQHEIQLVMDDVNLGAIACGQQHTVPISPGAHRIAFLPSWGAGAFVEPPETSGVYVVVRCDT